MTDGTSQVIPAGHALKDIRFKLLDDFSNPLTGIAGGNAIALTLTAPSGSMAELTPESAVTSQNGEITTRLTGADIPGSYIVTAQLETDETVFVAAYVFVTDPPPVLPDLGAGVAIDAEGMPLDTDAVFQGGFSLDGGAFLRSQTYSLNNALSVFVEGAIFVDSRHIGQIADIIVVAAGSDTLSFSGQEGGLCTLDSLTICRSWDGNIASLKAFRSNVILPEILRIPLWAGKFFGTGTITGWFGYRLSSGVMVFNPQPIEVTIIF
ncbi:MAG: hypothetical protein GY862_35245 [Gammaproteobacteria bacterium]|nr:hypothetical protein [Gammaproteobacteria bacterium]